MHFHLPLSIMEIYTSYLGRHPKLLASAVLISSPIAYLIYLHKSLAQTTHHVQNRGLLSKSSASGICSIPPSALESKQYMIHDRASKSISISLVPSLSQQELLTLYLRHTMRLFSTRFPQAYLLRLISSPEGRASFTASHISSLDFIPGDLVCGMYRVTLRTEHTVEFEMKPVGVVKGGRMVIGIVQNSDELLCSSETIMWKDAGEKGLMPLEMGVARWMHELASWWLLDSGTRFLKAFKKSN